MFPTGTNTVALIGNERVRVAVSFQHGLAKTGSVSLCHHFMVSDSRPRFEQYQCVCDGHCNQLEHWQLSEDNAKLI